MKRKLAEFLNVIFGFRKFLLMIMLFAVGIVFRIQDLINGEQLVSLLTSTTIAFFSANTGEHIINCVKSYTDSKTPAVVGPADTDESNDQEDVK